MYFESMIKFAIILVFYVTLGGTQGKCCISKPINCYDCDSRTDPRCKDPFNRSASPEDLPPFTPCPGCCVKWVRQSKTSQEILIRTCINQFSVNLFIVDRACMQEKSKMGHICFCEEEACNTSTTLDIHFVIYNTSILTWLFYHALIF